MAKPPSPPGRGLLVVIEVIGFLIVLFQVFRSHEPDSVKLGIVILLGGAFYTALVFHLGRRYEWSRLSDREGGDDGGADRD